MFFENFIKAIFFGIVEGITEWLPISSTGHLILTNEFIKMKESEAFMTMFNVVIQLGAILAVVVLYFTKLNPFAPSKSTIEKKDTWSLWFKVIVAIIPSAIIGLALDDWLDAHLYNFITVSLMLIIYGIAFIIVEKRNKLATPSISGLNAISYRFAFAVGAFQVLALIPGTSRSGATILGGILLGASRFVAAEFSFFLGIPTMFGASLLKIVNFIRHGNSFTTSNLVILLTGTIVSFLVSVIVIKFLMNYIKKHDFTIFGWYRIILGIILIAYYLFAM